jgi:hypothetical protein
MYKVNEESISWKLDGIEVHASLTRPVGAGSFPAVIFVENSNHVLKFEPILR